MLRWTSTIRGQVYGLALLPLGFLFLILVLVGILRYQSHQAALAVRTADQTLAQAARVTAAVTLVQRDVGRYYVNHHRADLESAERHASYIPSLTAALRRRTSDNAEQSRRATALSLLAAQMMRIERRYLDAASSGDVKTARAALNSPDARTVVAAWQRELAAFSKGETALRDARWARLQRTYRILDWVIGTGAFLGFLLTLFAAGALGRQIVRRLERLRKKTRRVAAGGDLGLPPSGTDEIADLDRAYHQMARAVREREAQLQKYRLLAQNARDIILFIRRADGRVVEANAAAAQTYGYSTDELEQLDAHDLRAPETRQRLDAELDRAEESPLIFETVHRRKDGSLFPVEIAAQTAVIGGEKYVLEIVRDITERRLAQQEVHAALKQAVAASRLKSEFLATMSHEIRTPLNAVIGMTELLMHSPLSEDQQHCAMVAHDSGEALLHLINDILDFSKIEAQRIDLEIIEFKLVQLVEGVAGLFASQAAKSGVALMTYVNPWIPQRLLGDPGRLRQILMNLTGNAVKFTQNGSVLITADLEHREEQSVTIAFSVKDTGIGIAPDAIAGLFEPFRQADGSMTRRYGGTGLGLSISKGLVELMGGSIAVRSVEGQGSTFSFALNLKIAEHQPQEPPDLSEMRALVLDDDPIALEVFSRYLTSWRMRCDVTHDALRACTMFEEAAAQADPYDVVLVDLAMPQMDGFQFADRIQATAKRTGARLIMVTAYDEPHQGRAAIDAGFAAYLTKPVRQSQLYDCIVNAAAGANVAAPLPPPQQVHAHHGLRILVAEDNAVNREVALRQLGKLGYAAQAVANGRQAVEATLSGQFDLVFMDCQMPEMDGFEATRAIRKAEARTGQHLRIVAMTANALAEDRQACIEAGMDDYLPKPVTLDALRRVLASLCAPPLDFVRLNELFDGDREGINEFLASALPALHRLIDRLQNAKDAAEQSAAAHELKGAAANAGAVEIAQIAADIESNLRNGNAEAPALITRLQEAYERVVSVEYTA